MKNILLQLYDGELNPSEFYSPILEAHKKARLSNRKNYELFSAMLGEIDQNLKEQFLEVMDNEIITAPFEACEMFVDGFRMGAKMMVEVFRWEE